MISATVNGLVDWNVCTAAEKRDTSNPMLRTSSRRPYCRVVLNCVEENGPRRVQIPGPNGMDAPVNKANVGCRVSNFLCRDTRNSNRLDDPTEIGVIFNEMFKSGWHLDGQKT